MKIDVTPLLAEVGRMDQVKTEEWISYPDDGLNIKEPIKIDAKLLNAGETILLNAKIEAGVEIECGRCLKKFIYPLSFEIEEKYSRSVHPVPAKKGAVKELTNQDFIFKIDKDNTIDLSEAVRQNILTQLPIKLFCDKCES